jgi:hypothetical protein
MPFTLSDVSDWEEGLSCVLTALSALNGQTPRQIHDVLRGIARRDGREIGTEFRADYCINDWLAAVNELGGQWAPSVDHSDRPFEERQTINDFMHDHPRTELELVLCDFAANSTSCP